ncbi:MAG: hypothetical protein NT019_00890 [Candidatus Adlerbacteria bacterium]|nr:hypothetical protein [Candidatus Adlerbacteria bacterium]
MKSKIEQQVMASVAVVYTARRLTSRFALECYALVLSFVGTVFFVSLPHVAANLSNVASGGVGSIEAFIISAVLGTKLIVQLALLVGACALVAMGVDMSRANSPKNTFAA